MSKTIKVYGEDGELLIPAKNALCTRCDGEGTHVNPAIDGAGLSREYFDEQGPEFEENYFSGVYDIPCEVCKGNKVVLKPDFDRMTKQETDAYYYDQDQEAQTRMEHEGEMRMMYGLNY